MKPILRDAPVGEHREVPVLARIRVHSLRYQRIATRRLQGERRVRRERGVDEGDRDTGYGTDFDAHGVVGDPPPIREPGDVAAQETEDARLGRWPDGQVQPQ